MAYKWHNSGAKLFLPAATYTPKLSWLLLMDPCFPPTHFPGQSFSKGWQVPLMQISDSSTTAYRKQVGYDQHLTSRRNKRLWCNVCAAAPPCLLIRLKLLCARDRVLFILSPPSCVSSCVNNVCFEEHPSQWGLCRWLPFLGPCSISTVFIAYIQRNKEIDRTNFPLHMRDKGSVLTGLKPKLGVPESKGTSCVLAMQMKRLFYSLSP